ncbi:permease [Prolixibacteraceae bacterium Z1-6]|uniref:Permease n=1 Tax=Draconibacterium aestuarii TaxID=2998507 RepID=A0A9X3J5N8_9BACT|nr:permease [Prolixibacteraceae bacterium Z1-6]
MIAILFNTLMESAPYIVLGFIIVGIMRYYVPPGILQKHLGSGSTSSLFKSVGVGCVLPLCSCGTIPLGIGLFRSGASIGNMLAFMTSTPILSPVLITVSLKLLGWKLTVALVLAAIIGSFVMGLVGNRIFNKPTKDKSRKTNAGKFDRSAEEKEPKAKIAKTLKWSFLNLGADVSVDILIGLGIASILLAFLPLEWISTWLGQQDLTTLLYVIILGIPVYACSIPSLVVVQGLLLLGATPGAAIAYMIAGPATNLGELNAIRKSMGARPAIFYALSLISLALIAGLITDQFVFPDYQYHAYRVQGELVVQQCCVPLIFGDNLGGPSTYAIPMWHWPFGAILASVIAYGTIKKLRFFFINPCTGCNWKNYGAKGTCGSKCHVRRKYEFIRKPFKS